MIFCHKCGAEQLEGSEFCRKCGAKLLTENSDETSKNAVHTETPQNFTQSTDNTNDANTVYEPVTSEVSITENKLHTKIVVLIVVCVLALAAAGIIVAVIMTNNKSDSKDTGSFSYVESSVDDENELYATYSSKEKEISFNYPSDWRTEKEDADNIQVAYGINKSKPQGAALVLRRCDKGTIDEMTDYYNQELAEIIMPYINNSAFLSQFSYGITDINIIDLNPITLDSVKAFRLEFTGKLYYYGEMHMVGYFYDTKYSGYQLILIYSDSERTKYEPIINKIIDSIRINIDETQTEPKTEANTEKPTEKKTEKATEKPTEKPTEPSLKAKDFTGTYSGSNELDGTLSIYGTDDTVYIQTSFQANMSVHSFRTGYGKLKNDTVKCQLHLISLGITQGTDEYSFHHYWEWGDDIDCTIKFNNNKNVVTISMNGTEHIYTKSYNSTPSIAGEVNIDSGFLNVRNSDSTDADVVGKLNKGDKVLILDNSSDWYVVVSDDVFGYAYGEFIKTYS